MNTYKITLSDGNTMTTSMNATLDEAKKYYIGVYFNFGDNDFGEPDRMVKAVKVEEI